MAWGARRGIDDVLQRVQANDPKLVALYLLSSRSFGESEASALCKALTGNTVLRELNISSHAVSPSMSAAFAELLASPSCALASLSLGNRKFGDEGLVALCPGIQANRSLTHLNLEAKGLTAAGCNALAGALEANIGIQELVLAQNELQHEGVAALALGMAKLRVLDVRSTGLEGGPAGEALAQVLRGGSLQVLRCEGNALGPEGAGALAPALAAAGALQQLYLSSCSLGPDGVQRLAACLPPRLAAVDLSDNAAGPAGAAALAEALAGGAGRALRSLVLCNNGIDDTAVVQLVGTLGGLSSGESSSRSGDSSGDGVALDLGGNEVGSAGLGALAACSQLASLRLHGCQLGEVGAAELARLIGTAGNFASLAELDVSANGFEAEGLLALLGALRASPEACPALRLLVLAANDGVEGAGVQAAVAALQEGRPELTLVRRAADSGELGQPGGP